MLYNRVESLKKFLSALSRSDENSELLLLLSKFGKTNRSLLVAAAEKVGLKVQQRMTPSEATQMQSLLRLSNHKMRELRRILKNTNIGNFLPSETKIRKVQADLTQHLSMEKVECGKNDFPEGGKKWGG